MVLVIVVVVKVLPAAVLRSLFSSSGGLRRQLLLDGTLDANLKDANAHTGADKGRSHVCVK